MVNKNPNQSGLNRCRVNRATKKFTRVVKKKPATISDRLMTLDDIQSHGEKLLRKVMLLKKEYALKLSVVNSMNTFLINKRKLEVSEKRLNHQIGEIGKSSIDEFDMEAFRRYATETDAEPEPTAT